MILLHDIIYVQMKKIDNMLKFMLAFTDKTKTHGGPHGFRSSIRLVQK